MPNIAGASTSVKYGAPALFSAQCSVQSAKMDEVHSACVAACPSDTVEDAGGICRAPPECEGSDVYNEASQQCEPGCPDGQAWINGQGCMPNTPQPSPGSSAPDRSIIIGSCASGCDYTDGEGRDYDSYTPEGSKIKNGEPATLNCGGWKCTVEYKDMVKCYGVENSTNIACTVTPKYTGEPYVGTEGEPSIPMTPPPTDSPPPAPPPTAPPGYVPGPGDYNPGSTGDPGTGDPGTGDPGTGDPGTGDPGTGDPGTGDPGTGDGTGDDGTNPGTGPDTGWEGLYQTRYPNGIAGVWLAKRAQLGETELFGLLDKLVPTIGGAGGCPSFTISAGTVLGVPVGGDISPPCLLWPFIAVVLNVTALFVARCLIFGG